MKYDYIVAAPGQGSQKPGVLDGWMDRSRTARRQVEEWSSRCGVNLIDASRDDEKLKDTAFAQPVIVAASLLSVRQTVRYLGTSSEVILFAGHSVGELAAAAAAGYITDADAVFLACVRGAAMSAACTEPRTGMAAVMPARRDPASDEEIQQTIHDAGLEIANWNGCHQYVAAGRYERIKALAEQEHNGVRVVTLPVAGAFHTSTMEPVVTVFEKALSDTEFRDAGTALVGNGDGEVVTKAADVRSRLLTQVTSPVRWDLCMRTLNKQAKDATFIELAPRGPLTRLYRGTYPDTTCVPVSRPEDLAVFNMLG
ncbi:ACP S-malonyltransferase [Actinomyces sp. 2119]|uniref:[acyl-carrier-protein] S-malonyltransferase n=1 Tax=Actinomyces lilanjuaniae TaxID=2321394 RepID=A0ABM6Z0V7_9ACTO|nr:MULTISPECIES: ACP S-malonyltransferase [Actinomyces]AYD88879.1 ACP S-malonyltransferase [Actinomyces lilanjuaniae]RJF43814.1 ACP S-malonyltransferase [Actinomyces sp. 2119]